MADNGQETTGVKDTTFDLISVVYHTLKVTSLYDTYIQDAEEAGDQEVLAFLRETQQAAGETAQRARALLAARMNR